MNRFCVSLFFFYLRSRPKRSFFWFLYIRNFPRIHLSERACTYSYLETHLFAWIYRKRNSNYQTKIDTNKHNDVIRSKLLLINNYILLAWLKRPDAGRRSMRNERKIHSIFLYYFPMRILLIPWRLQWRRRRILHLWLWKFLHVS